MSAGREREPGTRLGVSFEGARAADFAAVKTTSLMELCREMRSPLPPQHTWWSPKMSAVALHSGQVERDTKPVPERIPALSVGSRVGEGTTFSKSPACGRPDESANAWDRIVGAECRRNWYDDSSMACERWHCRMGISISFRPSQSARAAAIERAETAAVVWGEGPGGWPRIPTMRD